jgi:CO/xanthine dehydrogenase FAD-binding subunit
MSSNSRYKSKNDVDEAVSVVSLTSSSGGYSLIRSLKKFIFRYQELVEIYSISAEKKSYAMHFHIVKMYKDKEVTNCQAYFFCQCVT